MLRQKNLILISVIIILFSFALSDATPSITGGRGLFLVEDARSEDLGIIAVSSYILSHKDITDGYVGDLVVPHILYSPTSFLDLFFWTGRIITRGQLIFPKIWESQVSTARHDMVIGVKAYAPIPVLKLGAKISYAWQGADLTGVSLLKQTDRFNWTGLATIHLSELVGSLPNVMVNYSENSQTREYGMAIELAGNGGSLFIEAVSSEAKSVPMFDNVLDNFTITPGLRINLTSHSSISGGVILDVKKNPEIADYTAIFGLSIGGAILKPSQPKIGILTGTITDANTSNSLTGTISFPENPKIKSVPSDPQTGIFRIMKVPSGVQIAEITSPGYQKMTTAVTIETNKVNAYDFRLKPLITYGTIAGNVYDAASKKPLAVTLTFNNNQLPSVNTDPVTGAFKIEQVETGVLTVETNLDGYFAKAVTISVEQDKVTQVDLPLVASILRGYFIGRVVDKTNETPIQALISFPNTNLLSITTDSLTGTFQHEMPVGTYPVMVSADQYLSQTSIITIEKDNITESKFELNPAKIKTILTGKVSDKKTGSGIQAIISFPEVGIEPIKNDSATGVYRADVPIGSYLIEVKSRGYLSQTVMVVLEQDKTLEKNFELSSEEFKSVLYGRVSDANTNNGVKAVITIPELQMMQISTDAITGIYRAELAYGSYTINVNADGYAPQSAMVVLRKEEVLEKNFNLIPISVTSTLIGKVTDKKSGLGLPAIISFPNTELKPVSTDSITGIYQAAIPVGLYAVNVSADGYISSSAVVIMEKDKTLEKNFELVKAGMTITLKGVYFEINKATLKPESYTALQEAGKILIDNPNIKVEIQGHTDNTGSITLNQRLSEQRAYAVMNYLVTTLGITPERLTAKGYGLSNPIVSNTTAEGRALNRRVDFVILE